MSKFKNKLICGDNLEVLATMPKESIDLIYIDPPFFSNRIYEIIWGDEAEVRSFEDRWEGGINVYIEWMRHRVLELHRVLKSTGSFYLHCDWHASHYLKVMCDDVFGYNNFRNEIVWDYTFRMMDLPSFFNRKHDIILFYSKSENNYFNMLKTEWTREEIIETRKQKVHIDSDGDECIWMPGGKGHSKSKMKKIKDIIKDGKAMSDVWRIPVISSSAKERTGYPTQKPEPLLERIIRASSNKEDIVLDAFCGCGTALAVAEKLERHWIGIDISPSAIALIKKRLTNIKGFTTNYDVVGMPEKIDDLKAFKPYDFQYWVINEMHGIPSPKKVGDLGIDGLSFLNHYPIQVKQSESVGRNIVDNFETALRRYYKKTSKEMVGYIVAFSFTRGAHEEVARVKKEQMKIHLVPVQDILDKNFIAAKADLPLF